MVFVIKGSNLNEGIKFIHKKYFQFKGENKMLRKNLQVIILVLLIVGSSLAGDKIRLKLHQPPPNKMPVSSLWAMDIENTTKEEITIYLFGTVNGDRQGEIVGGTSKPFNLKPGKKTYGYEDFKSGEVKWVNKSIQEIIIRTGEVPEDNYTICVTAYYEDGNMAEQQQCIMQLIVRGSEGIITLVSPSDNEELKSENPINFMWTGTGLKGPYTLIIKELKNGQTNEQAMAENRVFFEKKDIKTTNYQYGLNDPKLEAGKKYVWVITVDEKNSEVYSFSTVLNSNCDNIQLDLIPITGNAGCFTFKINATVGYFNWVKLIYNPAIFSSATNLISGWNVNTNPSSPPFNWISWGGSYLPSGNHNIGQVCLNLSNLPAYIKYQTSTNSGSTVYCTDSFYVKEVNQPNVCKECDGGTVQGPNLVTNGNFDQGNTGFTSDAAYNHPSSLSPNQYDVVSDASTKNGAWSPLDHTGSGGNLFVCDGSDQNSTTIWSQTISVKPNTRYVLCGWARNLVLPPNNMNDPELILKINSIQIGGTQTLTESQGWRAGSVFWNSGSSATTAVIEIVLNSHEYGGNDVGLDDISFSECITNTKCKACEDSRVGPCLVTNNSFELGNTGFTSNAAFSNAYPLGSGEYSIVTNAVSANSNWVASAPSGAGNFLVCDGLTNTETIVWSQEIDNLTTWKQFIFCCWIKNLDKKDSNFDNPKIQLRISRWNGTGWYSPVNIGLVREPTTTMGWTELSETWGSNASTKAKIEIVSAATTNFLGNDIGLDDICFQEVLEQVDFSSATFTIATMNITASQYNIMATQSNPPSGHSFDWQSGDCGYWWQVCELDNNNNCKTNTILENKPNWWTFPSTTFPGYNGTTSQSTDPDGIFKIGKKYRISYGVWCRCLSWNTSSYIVSLGAKGEKLSIIEDKNYKPIIQNK